MGVNIDRVGWEDGTLVTPARVTVAGATYDVEDAQYSGTTPLTAQNLKKMEDNIIKVGTPTGAIMEYAGSTAPTEWLICDGSAVSRTTYANLYAVIGTTYGSGDGTTTFNLPNLKSRIPVGYDTAQESFNALGKKGGELTHTLTIAEMPNHTHNIVATHGTPTTGISFYPAESITTPYDTLDFNICRPTGGNSAHNNLQPYIVLNYIIKI